MHTHGHAHAHRHTHTHTFFLGPDSGNSNILLLFSCTNKRTCGDMQDRKTSDVCVHVYVIPGSRPGPPRFETVCVYFFLPQFISAISQYNLIRQVY